MRGTFASGSPSGHSELVLGLLNFAKGSPSGQSVLGAFLVANLAKGSPSGQRSDATRIPAICPKSFDCLCAGHRAVLNLLQDLGFLVGSQLSDLLCLWRRWFGWISDGLAGLLVNPLPFRHFGIRPLAFAFPMLGRLGKIGFSRLKLRLCFIDLCLKSCLLFVSVRIGGAIHHFALGKLLRLIQSATGIGDGPLLFVKSF